MAENEATTDANGGANGAHSEAPPRELQGIELEGGAVAAPAAPRKPAAGRTARADLPSGGEVRIRMPAAPGPAAAAAGAGRDGGTLADLSGLELFAGVEGGQVQVERTGPGVGPGWRGNRYKGVQVEIGPCGQVPNGSKMYDDAMARWGGARYRFVGTAHDAQGKPRRVEVEKVLPGAPKALTAEGEEAANEEAWELQQQEQLAAAGAGTLANANLGWVFAQQLGRYVWTGPGTTPTTPAPLLPPGAPGTFGAGFGGAPGFGFPMGLGINPALLQQGTTPATEREKLLEKELADIKARQAKTDDQRIFLDMLEKQNKEWEARLAKMLPAANQPAVDPLKGFVDLLAAQATKAENDRRAKEAADEKRYERERQERIDKEREDRQRREDADKERQRRDDLAEQARIRREEQEEKRRREDAQNARERDDKFMTMMLENKQDPFAMAKSLFELGGGKKSGMSEMAEMVKMGSSIAEAFGGKRSELDDVRGVIETAGKVIAEDIVPATAEAIGVWRSGGQPPPPPPQQTQQQQGGDAPAGQQRPQAPAPKRPAAPARPQPPQKLGVSGVKTDLPAPNAPRELSNDELLEILEHVLNEGLVRSQSPKLMVPAFNSFCLAKGLPVNAAVAKLKAVSSKSIKNQLDYARTLPQLQKEKPQLVERINRARGIFEMAGADDWFDRFLDEVHKASE